MKEDLKDKIVFIFRDTGYLGMFGSITHFLEREHIENFKSEYIQGIYDFLEQDADVTNFKRDLIAVAEAKKVELHDLEAQYLNTLI